MRACGYEMPPALVHCLVHGSTYELVCTNEACRERTLTKLQTFAPSAII
jgi:hypothetical protein